MMTFFYNRRMKRTTIQLEGVLQSQLKQIAHEQKKSLRAVINDVLRLGLGVFKNKPKKKAKFSWNVASSHPVSGFDPADRNTYLDVLSQKY